MNKNNYAPLVQFKLDIRHSPSFRIRPLPQSSIKNFSSSLGWFFLNIPMISIYLEQVEEIDIVARDCNPPCNQGLYQWELSHPSFLMIRSKMEVTCNAT